MSALERQDALEEAVAVLVGLQCLLAEARDQAEVPADALYALLDCVLGKLRRASEWRRE